MEVKPWDAKNNGMFGRVCDEKADFFMMKKHELTESLMDVVIWSMISIPMGPPSTVCNSIGVVSLTSGISNFVAVWRSKKFPAEPEFQKGLV